MLVLVVKHFEEALSKQHTVELTDSIWDGKLVEILGYCESVGTFQRMSYIQNLITEIFYWWTL